MAKSSIDNIWKLLRENQFEIDNDLPNDILCTLCKKIMIEPFAAICGCQFCSSCVRDYLIDDDIRSCPGDKAECADTRLQMDKTVLRDFRSNHNISKLVVKCRNELCKTRVDLGHMEEHIRVCGMNPASCPYDALGCTDERLTQDDVRSHLSSELFSHSQLLIEAINNLRNDVGRLSDLVMTKEIEIANLREDSKSKEIMMAEMKHEIENLKQMNTLRDSRINESVIEEPPNNNEDKETMVKWMDSVMADIKELRIYEEKEFIWRIDKLVPNVIVKRRSVPFYRNSYKLYLRLGIDDKSLGLGCYLMPGEFDEFNTWPMRHSVKLSILNQYTMNPFKTERFNIATFGRREAFSRPMKEINEYCIGNDDFLLNEELTVAKEICRGNCVIVSCLVEVE